MNFYSTQDKFADVVQTAYTSHVFSISLDSLIDFKLLENLTSTSTLHNRTQPPSFRYNSYIVAWRHDSYTVTYKCVSLKCQDDCGTIIPDFVWILSSSPFFCCQTSYSVSQYVIIRLLSYLYKPADSVHIIPIQGIRENIRRTQRPSRPILRTKLLNNWALHSMSGLIPVHPRCICPGLYRPSGKLLLIAKSYLAMSTEVGDGVNPTAPFKLHESVPPYVVPIGVYTFWRRSTRKSGRNMRHDQEFWGHRYSGSRAFVTSSETKYDSIPIKVNEWKACLAEASLTP